MKYISNSEQDTINIAKKFASELKNNDVIVLTGELGAGKTKFMYGIAEYFKIQNVICSPTFTIVNEYILPQKINEIKSIYHFDVYRIQDAVDFVDSIGTDYFDMGLCFIEWGKNIQDILPNNTIYITISKDENNVNKRIIEIERENV